MLTYSMFGTNGRLGNQMFQFAAIYAAAKRLGVNFFLYERSNPNATNFETIDDFLQFNVKTVKECQWIKNSEDYIQIYKTEINKRFVEPHFHYMSEFENLLDKTDLNGFYQTDKYFSNLKQDLCKIFTLSNKSKAYEAYETLIKGGKYISVHLRRGDYVNKSNYHNNLASSYYYYKAVMQLKMTYKDVKFLIFSDDIEFCKDYFTKYFEENVSDFEYVTETTGPEEICLQSLCFGNIIANSSFSWWGAWLNTNNGPVVAPKNWFGPDGPKDIQDVYCQDWIVV